MISVRDLLARNPCLSPEQIERYAAAWPEGLPLSAFFAAERIATKQAFIAREVLPASNKSLERLTREHIEWGAAELLPPEAFEAGLRELVHRAAARFGTTRYVRAAAQQRIRPGSSAKRLARVGAHLRAAGFAWREQIQTWERIARELDEGREPATLSGCAGS